MIMIELLNQFLKKGSNYLAWLKPHVDLVAILLAVIAILPLMVTASGMFFVGEGTHHANITYFMIDEASINPTYQYFYPGLYENITVLFQVFLGEFGLKILSTMAIFLSSLTVYALLKKLGSQTLAFISIPFIIYSPKFIRYGVEPLNEILQTFFILVLIYYAVSIFYRASQKPRLKDVVVIGLIVGAIAVLKQQGLLVGLAGGVLVLLYSKNMLRDLLIYGVTTMIFLVPFYGSLIGRTGVLLEPDRRIIARQELGETASPFEKIIYPLGTDKIDVSTAFIELEEFVADQDLRLEDGILAFEEKHISLFSQLKSPTDFVRVNSLYYNPVLPQMLLFIILIIFTAYGVYQKDRFIIFLLSFWLLAQIFLSYGGYGTEKYFMFLPILSIIMLTVLFIKLRERYPVPVYGVINLFIVFVILVTVPSLQMIYRSEGLDNTQGYTPSIGGMESVIEVADYIVKEDSQGVIFSPTPYEWNYYTNSDRHIIDARVYFLESDELDFWLKRLDVDYVVVKHNRVVEDSAWRHHSYLPKSFVFKVSSLYTPVYESTYKDITVYKIDDDI